MVIVGYRDNYPPPTDDTNPNPVVYEVEFALPDTSGERRVFVTVFLPDTVLRPVALAS